MKTTVVKNINKDDSLLFTRSNMARVVKVLNLANTVSERGGLSHILLTATCREFICLSLDRLKRSTLNKQWMAQVGADVILCKLLNQVTRFATFYCTIYCVCQVKI